MMQLAFEDPERAVTPEELVEYALTQPATFAPSAEWSYSNTGYTLVGMILEKATSCCPRTR